MGYTQFSVDKLEKIISEYNPKSVIDLGAQNLYNQPLLPAPYASEFYAKKGISYDSIDLSGENGAWESDLSKPDVAIGNHYDMVVDCGTSEHVGDNGKFSWEAIYNCWKTKHDLLKTGGVMYSENPKHLSWPFHGFQYYTQGFYTDLAELTDYEILDLGENAAMGNETDGWNIYCTMRKHSNKFCSLEEFKTFSLMQS